MKQLVVFAIPEGTPNKNELCSALSPNKNGYKKMHAHTHVQDNMWVHSDCIWYSKWLMTDEERCAHKKLVKKIRRLPYGTRVSCFTLTTL